MMKVPCGKNCPGRHYACHDTCEKYLAFVEYSRRDYEKRKMRCDVNYAKFSFVTAQMRKTNIYKGKPIKTRNSGI